MTQNHRSLGLAIAALAVIGAGCGTVGTPLANPKAATANQPQANGATINRPVAPGSNKGKDTVAPVDSKDKGFWTGTIGNSNVSLQFSGTYARCVLGGNQFVGSIYAGLVSGNLTFTHGGSSRVSLQYAGNQMTGYIGSSFANSALYGNGQTTQVVGTIGQKNMVVNAWGNSLSGTMNGNNLFISGAATGPSDAPGLVASLLCALYLVN